jgi:hypothetical protein
MPSTGPNFEYSNRDGMSDILQQRLQDIDSLPELMDDTAFELLDDSLNFASEQHGMTPFDHVNLNLTCDQAQYNTGVHCPSTKNGESRAGSTDTRSRQLSMVCVSETPSSKPQSEPGNRQTTPSHGASSASFSRLAFFRSESSPGSTLIIKCANLLGYVEEMCRCSTALDEVLRVNKETMKEVKSIVTSDCWQESCGTMTMLVATVQQVVALLETNCLPHFPYTTLISRSGCDTVEKRGSILRARHVAATYHRDTHAPGIDFGCFDFDPEEQRSLLATIVSREIQRTLDVIDTLVGPRMTSLRQGSTDMETVKRLLKDVKQRASDLHSCVSCEQYSRQPFGKRNDQY